MLKVLDSAFSDTKFNNRCSSFHRRHGAAGTCWDLAIPCNLATLQTKASVLPGLFRFRKRHGVHHAGGETETVPVCPDAGRHMWMERDALIPYAHPSACYGTADSSSTTGRLHAAHCDPQTRPPCTPGSALRGSARLKSRSPPQHLPPPAHPGMASACPAG